MRAYRKTMSAKNIFVKGAREHNLKNIDIEIPRDKLVVLTGLSGSGKSSLAFDTIYAEGQRRYVESLSSYARQFLGQMEKPDVDYIEGLSPAISIDQKTTSKNPRSTVGTVTEWYFDSTLTTKETSILAYGLIIAWMEQNMLDITQMNLHLSTKDFKNFSESQNLKQKSETLDKMREDMAREITEYQLKNLSNLTFFGGA